ncbi:MAG: endonuclease MutS2 [Bacilli bacterium]|nr:endonuclease MutS2 [Bacilli bacterium]
MLDIYATLEIKKILEQIQNYSKSELARSQIINLKMYGDRQELQFHLSNLKEMMELLNNYGNLPLEISFDISKFITIAKKDGILSPLELDHIALDIINSRKIFEYFKKVDENKFPLLKAYSRKLNDESFIYNNIKKCIADDLSIKSTASNELLNIRNNITKIEKNIREHSLSLINQYKDYLTDNTISIRNDHFVLPVKSTYKNIIPGIIHDVSSTGSTIFIEPNSLVMLSNQLYVLKCEEKEEINRILKSLTSMIANEENQLLTNNKIIAQLDFISSKAIYGINKKGIVAKLILDRKLEIKEARHPLIDENKVVTNSFYFDQNQRIIIISGPNAGGKTVALKTLGLMVMMNQMAIPLLTKEEAILPFFPRIYADIGDNQSLVDNLSTFAAHISNLSTITHFVSNKDLVLIDELGTGTSPNEGEAIAIAITNFLLNKNCFALISSHFESMKQFAYSKNGIVNAMMIFDDKKLLPTYLLKIGLPGKSYGLEMAKRYHLDESIVSSAKEYLNKHQSSNINDVLDNLSKIVNENENLKKELENKQKEITKKEKQIERQLSSLNEKNEHFDEEMDKIKSQLIDDAKKQIDDIYNQLLKEDIKQHQIIKAKRDLDLLNEEKEQIVNNEEIHLNDFVKTDLGFIGKVIRIKGDNLEIITNSGMSIKANKNNVNKTNKVETSYVPKLNVDEMVDIKSNVKLELNLIGYHIDEALPVLGKYLDDCILKHFTSVRIIHGMGTGQLREAIWEYLKKVKFIKEFHYASYNDGGQGATIVVFK